MEQLRIYELAKKGVLKEISDCDLKIKTGESYKFNKQSGTGKQCKKSIEEIDKVISKYRLRKAELEHEYDEINNLIFFYDFK